MISPKQKKILAFRYSRYDYLICDGSIRSGKTSNGYLSFVDDGMERYNNQNFIVLGNTIGAVRRNVINPYMSLYYAKKKYQIDYNIGSSCLTVTRGNVTNRFFVFGANNERAYEGIQGMTAAGLFVDQVELCNRNAVYIALGRLSVDGAKVIFNCNPSYPLHWFNVEWIQRAEERNALYLKFTMDDNPSLSEKTKRRISSQYSGVFYDRYILGEWVVAEGLVYQFDREQYVISQKELDAIIDHESEHHKKGRWFISIDYGITNPFAALLWYVTATDAYMVEEYYFDSKKEGRRRTDGEHLDAVEMLAGDRPIQEVIIDPSATSFKEEMYRRGRFYYQNANNDVKAGIQFTTQCIAEDHLKIAETCTNTLTEFGMYRWDEDKVGDAVIKENDHCVTGDTLIATERGEVPISKLVGKSGNVWSYDGTKAVLKPFSCVRMTRKQAEVYEITTEDGRTLRCTGDHLIMTERGWVECQYLKASDRIISI